jgi:hypothetical protein
MAKTKDDLVEEAQDAGIDVNPDEETKADIEAKLDGGGNTASVAAASAEGGGAWPTDMLLARQEALSGGVDVSAQYTSHEDNK